MSPQRGDAENPRPGDRYYFRVLRELQGVLDGIACDGEITREELVSLSGWLATHDKLLGEPPFCEIGALVHQIMLDDIVDPDEEAEILDWCNHFATDRGVPICTFTDAIQDLHGLTQGILMDGYIADAEIYRLREWLLENRQFATCWPVNDLWKLMSSILEDGLIDDAEREMLTDFCANFLIMKAEEPKHDEEYDKRIPVMGGPVVESFTAICAPLDQIVVPQKAFCFTGKAQLAKRKTLEEATIAAGGEVKGSVSLKLNYLVIGAASSPHWMYSTYGRKVEAAMSLQCKHGFPLVIHEEDWATAVVQAGGPDLRSPHP